MISNQNSLLLSPICSVTTQQTTENYSINFISNSFSNLSMQKTIRNLNFYEKSEENDNNIDEGKNDFIQAIKSHCFKNKNKQNIK